MGEPKQLQLQQQHSMVHPLMLPAGFHQGQKRYSTPNLTREVMRNLGAYDGPVPLMKAFSSVPHEGLSARNPVWTEVQSALIGAFNGRTNPNLGRTAQLVRLLGKTVSAGVVFEYLEKSLLKKGFKILCRRMEHSSEDPEELLESLDSVWRFFHGQLVTELKCVLQPMGLDLQALERSLMLKFRDHVLLPSGLYSYLKSEATCGRGCSLPSGLTQMLLILQMHRDAEPPSESDVVLERMMALTVKPYIGFLGVYNGSEEPEHRANVAALVKTRRRLTRRAYISRNALFRGSEGLDGSNILAMVVADDEFSDREEGEEENEDPAKTAALTGYPGRLDEVAAEEGSELGNSDSEKQSVVDGAEAEGDWLSGYQGRGRFASEPKADPERVIFV